MPSEALKRSNYDISQCDIFFYLWDIIGITSHSLHTHTQKDWNDIAIKERKVFLKGLQGWKNTSNGDIKLYSRKKCLDALEFIVKS